MNYIQSNQIVLAPSSAIKDRLRWGPEGLLVTFFLCFSLLKLFDDLLTGIPGLLHLPTTKNGQLLKTQMSKYIHLKNVSNFA